MKFDVILSFRIFTGSTKLDGDAIGEINVLKNYCSVKMSRTYFISFTAPFNNTQNLKFISPPTVVFFAAVNHDLNTSAISRP